ncbi:hypothetical protein ACL7TT_00875 [Microbulbifer sp. 2304DJ12-6]|uniref:hypothetical protein n=1 Tax=Microbulbifer sp. 2304DJ12-6 TaxID=3233340 RepID=UPI0039AF87F3
MTSTHCPVRIAIAPEVRCGGCFYYPVEISKLPVFADIIFLSPAGVPAGDLVDTRGITAGVLGGRGRYGENTLDPMLVLFCQGATAQTGRQGLPSSSGSHAIAYSATANGYRGSAIDWRFAVTPYLFLPLRTQGEPLWWRPL